MQAIAKKLVSFQLVIFIMLGAILGFSITSISEMPNRLMGMLILGIAFPFIAFIIRDVRRFLLMLTVLVLPLMIDVNFKHIMENQAGAHTMGISIRDVFVILLLFWWLIELLASDRPPVRLHMAVTFPALLYVEVAVLSMLWAPRTDLATLEIVQMAKVFIMFIVIANNIRDYKDVRYVLWALVASVVLQGTIASMQIATGGSLSLGFLGEIQIEEREVNKLFRAGGTLGHPNRLAMFLELLIPLVISTFLIEKNKLLRLLAFFIWGLAMATMIMTGSRGGWVGILIALFVYFLILSMRGSIKLNTVFRTFFIVIICFGVVLSFFSDTIERRIFGEDYGSAFSRIPMFQIAFSVIEAHPLTGVGINNYAEVMREYNNTVLSRRFGMDRPVHNIYLLITSETGVIGLLVFLWMVIALLAILYKTTRVKNHVLSLVSTGLFAGFVAFLVHGLVDKHTPGGNPLFYFLIAFSMAIASMAKREKMVDGKR